MGGGEMKKNKLYLWVLIHLHVCIPYLCEIPFWLKTRCCLFFVVVLLGFFFWGGGGFDQIVT